MSVLFLRLVSPEALASRRAAPQFTTTNSVFGRVNCGKGSAALQVLCTRPSCCVGLNLQAHRYSGAPADLTIQDTVIL